MFKRGLEGGASVSATSTAHTLPHSSPALYTLKPATLVTVHSMYLPELKERPLKPLCQRRRRLSKDPVNSKPMSKGRSCGLEGTSTGVGQGGGEKAGCPGCGVTPGPEMLDGSIGLSSLDRRMPVAACQSLQVSSNNEYERTCPGTIGETHLLSQAWSSFLGLLLFRHVCMP